MGVKITVRNDNIEAALGAFKNKVDRANILEEYKARQAYIKPSVIKREKKKIAIKNAKKTRNSRHNY